MSYRNLFHRILAVMLVAVPLVSISVHADYPVLSSETGRFVFGEVCSQNLYMLDTYTGDLWKISGSPSKPGKLEKVPYDTPPVKFPQLDSAKTTSKLPIPPAHQ